MIARSAALAEGDTQKQQDILRFGATILEMAGQAEQAQDDEPVFAALREMFDDPELA